MPRAASAPPLGVWSIEANASRFAAISASLPAIVDAIAPVTHEFRRDLLAFYKAASLIPHPQLLPFHPDEEDPTLNGELLTSAVAYDLSKVDTVCVKNWQLDDGSVHGLCFALRQCPSVHTLLLFNVQLRADLCDELFKLLPHTSVTRLHLEWNSSPDEELGAFSPSPSALEELLRTSSGLSSLSLRACGLTSDHAVAIASALRNGSKLAMLNLFENALGDDGALAIAYALPFTTSLTSLSLGNAGLTGKAARVLVDVLTPTYVAPPAVLKLIEDAEPRIQAEIDHAKKAKKKLDRAAAVLLLGLPVLETVDGVVYAPGNTTLEDLVLSGNTAIEAEDVAAISETLETHRDKMEGRLKRVKMQRVPAARAAPPPLSAFLSI